MTERRKRRSAAEMIEARQAELNKLQIRAAMETAKSDPILAPVVDKLAQLAKDELNAKKGFGSGPQSFETRKKSHQLWLDEIGFQEAYAQILLEQIEDTKGELKSLLATFVDSITQGEEVEAESVAMAVTYLETNTQRTDALRNAEAAVAQAQIERENFNREKRMPKSASLNHNA